MSRTHIRALCVLAAFAMARTSACIPAARVAGSGSIPAAFIDSRSGPLANAGASARRHIRTAFDRINARGGAAGYRVGLAAQDSTGSVQDARVRFRLAVDPGSRFDLQGPGIRTGARSEPCVTAPPASGAISAGGEPA